MCQCYLIYVVQHNLNKNTSWLIVWYHMLTSFDLFYISYTLLSWAFNELMVSIQLLQIRGLTFQFYVFSRNMIRVLLKFVCIIVVICRHVESRLLLTFEARIHVTNRKLKYLKCSMKVVWGDQIQFSTNATICPFYYTTMKVISLDILANLYFSLRFTYAFSFVKELWIDHWF